MSGVNNHLSKEQIIFSRIPAMVQEIEAHINSTNNGHEKQNLPLWYGHIGVQIENNKVVKIKHDSLYLHACMKIEASINAIWPTLDDDEKQNLLLWYRQIGVQIENNRVVKIEHNSVYLQGLMGNSMPPQAALLYLQMQGFMEETIPKQVIHNPFTFYIGSYRPEEDSANNSIKIFPKLSKNPDANIPSSKIGKGTFGAVKLVTEVDSAEKKVVMKKIEIIDEKHEQNIANEITALQRIGQYKDHIKIGNYMYIFSDFIPGASLARDNNSQGNTLEKILIAEKLVEELMQLHATGVFHFDIKPDNAIYDPVKKEAHFIDYGSSKLHNVGELWWWEDVEVEISLDGMSPGYIPPEAEPNEEGWHTIIQKMASKKQDKQQSILQQEYAPVAYAKVDIYQLGVLLRNIGGVPQEIYEMMTKPDPLQRATLEEVQQAIIKHKQMLQGKLHDTRRKFIGTLDTPLHKGKKPAKS